MLLWQTTLFSMQTYNTTGQSTVDQKFLEINGESTVTNWSCICVNLQFGQAAIHQAHSLESTTQFKCPHKSFVLFVEFFPLVMIAFELLQQPVQGIQYFILHLHFLFLALVDKTVHFPVFLVASVILASLDFDLSMDNP